MYVIGSLLHQHMGSIYFYRTRSAVENIQCDSTLSHDIICFEVNVWNQINLR